MLAAIGAQEVRAFGRINSIVFPQKRRAPLPRIVACARALDLPNLGSQIRQQLR
jgi:hypothetical protein